MNVQNEIITDKERFPITFNVNVIDAIQQKYGDLNIWGDLIEGNIRDENGKIVEKKVPSIKDLKWFITVAINEGIDIENEEKEIKRLFITESKAGRIITELGINKMVEKTKKITTDSILTDKQIEEAKNV